MPCHACTAAANLVESCSCKAPVQIEQLDQLGCNPSPLPHAGWRRVEIPVKDLPRDEALDDWFTVEVSSACCCEC